MSKEENTMFIRIEEPKKPDAEEQKPVARDADVPAAQIIDMGDISERKFTVIED